MRLKILILLIVLSLVVAPIYFLKKTSSTSPKTDISDVLGAKIVDVYGQASNITTGNQRATAYDSLIVGRGQEDKVRAAKSAGFKGPSLQYIVADALIGPAKLHSPDAQKRTCAQLGISDIQANKNNINMYKDFCKIHDSIVTKQTLVDLNLDGKGDVAATESWFLHDTNGNRIYRSSGGGTGYFPNPSNEGVKQIFKERILYELRKNNTEYLFDGIYLDNVALGYGNTSRYSGKPVELSTATIAADAVYGFVQYISQSIKAVNSKYLLWANMIGGSDDSKQWDRFSPYLDGALHENFVVNWNAQVHSAATIYKQLLQAQKWIADGNIYNAVAQGDGNNTLGRFGLAAFLLVDDGIHGYYHYTNYFNMYNYFYYLPEYETTLGTPVGPFEITAKNSSGIPIAYKRTYTCGVVTLDVANKRSTITTNACQTTAGAISDLTVKDTLNSGDWSIQNNLQLGNELYGDRTYKFVHVPQKYLGTAWIQTANDSRSYTNTPLVTFKLSQNATVYVAFDDRILKRPSWLSDWTNTGDNLDAGGDPFSVYQKSFPAGVVSLGPNGGGNIPNSMYIVLVRF